MNPRPIGRSFPSVGSGSWNRILRTHHAIVNRQPRRSNRETGDPKDARKLAEARAETAYDVAKEKCEDLALAQQMDCKKAAKDTERAALNAAKAMTP